jgi:hypothetical protein
MEAKQSNLGFSSNCTSMTRLEAVIEREFFLATSKSLANMEQKLDLIL